MKHLLKTLPAIVFLVLAFAAAAPVASAADQAGPSLFSQYNLPGNPRHVYVETPDRVWYTIPDADMVVLLEGETVVEYPTGAGSKPYNLLMDGGFVWVTLSGGNAIGRLTPATKALQTYPIPTANSEPTGITAGGGYIWFVERKGDNLGRLDPTSGQITEYTDKNPNDTNLVDMTGALLESAAYSVDGVWFTGPAFVSSVALFRPATETFTAAPAGSDAETMAIAVDNSGDTWIASRGTNRLGRFGLNTLGVWQWYTLPAGAAGPDSLFIREANGRREIWYARSGANRVGAQYATFSGVPITQVESELPVSGAAPWGISVDSNGQVWTAPTGVSEGIAWNTPYFQQFLYLPSMRRP